MVGFQFAKSILEIILIIICFTGIVLVGIEDILQNYFNDLSGTIALTQSQHVKTDRTVRAINQTLIQLEKIQKNYYPATPHLIPLINAMPPNISLDSMELDSVNKNFNATGIAATRNDLLNYKQALENTGLVQKIDLPLSQLTKKDNLAFSLNAELK
jgi:hypothetical protein